MRREGAVWIGDNPRLFEDPRIAHLDERGDREPSALSTRPAGLGLLPERWIVDVLEKRSEDARKVTLLVEHRAAGVDIGETRVVWHVTGLDDISEPELRGVHATLSRDEIDHA